MEEYEKRATKMREEYVLGVLGCLKITHVRNL
jgi:hypothetical protein